MQKAQLLDHKKNIKQSFDRFVDSFWTCLNEGSVTDYSKDELFIVCYTLTEKILSHCNAAENLHWNGYPSESLIILRSAFETSVAMNYLAANPDHIDNYINHSDLVAYKDLLLWSAHGLVDSDREKELYEKEILEFKNHILMAKFYEKCNLSEDNIDDVELVARRVKGIFCSIDKMAECLKNNEPHIFDQKFWQYSRYIYNTGSQHTHPIWNQAKKFFGPNVVIDSPNGFFSDNIPTRSIVMIFLWTVIAWENASFISLSKAGDLKILLADTITVINQTETDPKAKDKPASNSSISINQ